jgi:putative alpha-1,2-mannosidase
MKTFFMLLFLLSFLSSGAAGQKSDSKQPNVERWCDYVNPFIGTDYARVKYTQALAGNFDYANVHPGAVVPWGMVAVSPHNTYQPKGTTFGEIPGGYKYGNKTMCGFGQLHLSGVGCPDLGNFITMPWVGRFSPVIGQNIDIMGNETASPGYYSVELIDKGILAEVSATTRTTILKFTFSKATDTAVVILDLFQNIAVSIDGHLSIINPGKYPGSRVA